ncbi:MAG: hypothetical protein EOO01_21750, partial [Chitinophagaceae bacterium]
LFSGFSPATISSIEKLPKSGGDREYYRIKTEDENSFIATYNSDVKENEAFTSWAGHFQKKRLPVPVIYAVSDDGTMYIQEDLGSVSLLDLRLKEKENEHVYRLYEKALFQLARMQILGDEGLDYSKATTSGVFGKEAVMHDLLYFKFYFLDTLRLKYDRERLLKEFDILSQQLSSSSYIHFMFRDFQGRNIMVRNDEVVFIDFQGGMKGPVAYDAASLLWQAKAELNDKWRRGLFESYMNSVEEISGRKLDRSVFIEEYKGFVLLRLLQVLGAYGFRGLFEKKQHFIASISKGIENLLEYKTTFGLDDRFSELSKVLSLVTDNTVAKRFENISGEHAPLLVSINSFSFTQRGYPPDGSGNGGGFVFDCRGIMNPGRIDEYKPLTGRDESVKVYLEQHTRMPEFLQRVFDTVDITVENYIERGFENLTINFGCTGGRHRSVYAADALSKHLQEKYRVRTTVKHLEQNFTE